MRTQETTHLGESRNLNLDITGVLRLKLVVTYASSVDVATYSHGAWGDARFES
ncbi:NPCBM/NEW2 domain-containing protein [Streptomyces cavernicola]|uniref:NPCBM/NEW2 domain-containing protein n=1 Tax=Streptomyces cavernicola TaxID=3043613 RepID=UPI0038D0C966